MAKLGVKPSKTKPVPSGQKIGAKPIQKIGAHPVKMKPVFRGGGSNPQPQPYQGGLLQYTIDSPPEAYAQQQAITGQLHDAYLAQLTPGLNDLIGGVGKILQFLLEPKNWLTIGGMIVGIFLVLLTINAIIQSEGKQALSNVVQSQGFSLPKRKKK